MKRVNLVYFSATDVSKKYAKAAARAFNCEVKAYDFTLPKDRDPKLAPAFEKDEFVILSLPVYGGRIPPVCDEYVKALKGDGTPCMIIATYGNRDFEDALAEMEDIMNDGGFVVTSAAAVVGRHSFSDEIAGNRPDKDDLAGMERFALKVIENGFKPIEVGKIPGNRPYKERNSAPNTLMPVTSDECINCKSCAKRCPNGVISVENPKLRVKDASACLRCHRCVVYCPKHAISFVGEGYDKMVAGCIARFGKPDKENLYFM